jgi:hypothetical protein
VRLLRLSWSREVRYKGYETKRQAYNPDPPGHLGEDFPSKRIYAP